MNKILLILSLILLLFIIYSRTSTEHYSNTSTNYLYPIKGLSPICAKQNLLPSYMPKVCYVDGKLNSYANCKCEDKEGNCKICYDTIKKDSNNSNIVYNADSEE